MADELRISGSINYDDSESDPVELGIGNVLATVSTKLFARLKQSVTTTEAALKLGAVSSLGWCIIKNLDATNFVNVKTATGGTVFAKIPAGKIALFHFGSGVTAPFVQADGGTCQIEILLASQ